MYYNEQHNIYHGHPLYDWCNQVCHDATNLKNAVRFRQRNVMTGLTKQPKDRHLLEQQVINEFQKAIKLMNKKHHQKQNNQQNETKINEDKYHMPTSDTPYASYNLLVGVMTLLDNPDYNTDALCANASQRLIKACDSEIKSFFKARKAYLQNPEKFSGEPQLPGYLRKGSATTAIFTSAGVHYNETIKNNKTYYTLTLPKAPQQLKLGEHKPKGRIKEIRIVPTFNFFTIHITTEDNIETLSVQQNSKRIVAIDLGVDNFAAVTNNCGLPSLLFKGGAIKADNQYYNKRMAEEQSKQMKGGDKFEITEKLERVIDYRNNRVRDFCLKVSKRIVDWCVENRIDTIVCGLNRSWKQKVNLGKHNNQEFVFLPHSQFVSMLAWRCERAGVKFIESEESYTSKASFLDNDYIPYYGDEKPDDGWCFSGYRAPTISYWRERDNELENYKVNPRGLFKSRKFGVVNSDLNGSANILCKNFPLAFDSIERASVFNNVIVFSHPDIEFNKLNRKFQLKSRKSSQVSQSKFRRLVRKGKCSPTGIELCG